MPKSTQPQIEKAVLLRQIHQISWQAASPRKPLLRQIHIITKKLLIIWIVKTDDASAFSLYGTCLLWVQSSASLEIKYSRRRSTLSMLRFSSSEPPSCHSFCLCIVERPSVPVACSRSAQSGPPSLASSFVSVVGRFSLPVVRSG